MTRAARSLALAAGLAAACAGARPELAQPRSMPTPLSSSMEGRRLGVVLVALEFQPVLPAPGRLQVVHESGDCRDVATQCTGVTLAMQPGPALLRLVVGERSLELALHVEPDMPVVTWDVASVLRAP